MSQAEGEQPRDALATLRIPRRDEPRRRGPWARLLTWGLVLALLAAIGGGGLWLAGSRGWLSGLG